MPDVAYIPCAIQGRAHSGKTQLSCPACVGRAVNGIAPKAAKPRRERTGSKHEAAMKAALDAAGYIDTTFREAGAMNPYDPPQKCYRREVPWGILLPEPRRFSCDFAFLSARLIVEIVGMAHGNYSMLRRDLDREQLARSIGWTVLRIDPEWIDSGKAVEEVKSALSKETP